MPKIFACLCLSLLCYTGIRAQKETLQLEKMKLEFMLDGAGSPQYEVSFDGKPVILSSRLGFSLNEDSLFSQGFVLKGVERTAVDETWQPVWGETKNIRNHYAQLIVHLQKGGAAGAGWWGWRVLEGQPGRGGCWILFSGCLKMVWGSGMSSLNSRG